MAAIKGKNTKPEMVVRRLVHRLGYRYALHRKDLPGKPDLVFARRGNVDRDRASEEALANQGWKVLVVWECETKDPVALAKRVRSFLG